MKYEYTTKGTCSRMILLDMEGDVVKDVEFIGGCNGNLKGISALVKGMKYEDIKEKLEGITCGFRSTSCPDQLVKAVAEAIAHE